MATSSIFHNVVVKDKKQCSQLLNAIERSRKVTVHTNSTVPIEKCGGIEIKNLFTPNKK